jgi:hypothetical protein
VTGGVEMGAAAASEERETVDAVCLNEPCFTCQRNTAEGYIARYDISVCRACWDGNWDGWARNYETRIIEHRKGSRCR